MLPFHPDCECRFYGYDPMAGEPDKYGHHPHCERFEEHKFAVYVAGSSQEIPRVKAAQKALVDSGLCRITCDWCVDMELARMRGITSDAQLSFGDQLTLALQDTRDGIDKAQLLLWLSPVTPSRGAYVELGYGIGRDQADQKIVIYAAGESRRDTIFASLASGLFDTDEAAIEAALRLAAHQEKSWPTP